MLTLPIIDATDGVQTPEHCSDCGGVCCKQFPGIAVPSDFWPRRTMVEAIASLLKSGDWSIDWWEGDPRKRVAEKNRLCQVYYVRPATVHGKGKVRDPSYGGACVLFVEGQGCSLEFRNRPHECRHLAGAPFVAGKRRCNYDDGTTKEKTVRKWIPYQAEVIAAMELALAAQEAQ